MSKTLESNITDGKALLLNNVRPIGFDATVTGTTSVLIDQHGNIRALGTQAQAQADTATQVIECTGAWISPGWTDLHAHVWRGGTDISIDPSVCGVARGVTTVVDAGSAGEANFAGFREFIIEPAQERIKAFLNLGSIGLTASRYVSELTDMRDVNIDRIMECVQANRDVIVGIKVRASGAITGSWGITPVKLAKRIAKILKVPVMAHVGEPPPLIDEVMTELSDGDVITHCFNGKYAGSIIEDQDLFDMAVHCADRGIALDVGHGGASFSYRTAKVSIERGLMPFSISTDVHARSLEGKVWDLGTTMSKLLAMGMPLEAVIRAVTVNPNSIIKIPTSKWAIGERAEFTVFGLEDSDIPVIDSHKVSATLSQIFEPRWTILGNKALHASRYQSQIKPAGCPHCGGVL
ncbi:Deacetylase [Pandoraea horticolens]|uniref:Deacetylase n=1 Tax=Pandoraea horticolens TaxID=2508298 RepID=A0A5E4X9G2_9BURK|nr:amidohydrolase/deacetylase family metallohydrolase [Pandoraea horticolens]VVE32933.1 Deacetylase [Pandoraea horticolens]